jgi:hypothetical protein
MEKLQRNREARKIRQDDGFSKCPISLELACSRISTWEDVVVIDPKDVRQLSHWESQTHLQPSKRTVLLENGTISKPYRVIQSSGVPGYIHKERKESASIKKRENGLKQAQSHPIEGASIKTFLDLRHKSFILSNLFDQLEFEPVFDGLYADVMVKMKHQTKWTMLQFKSATWKVKKTVTYLRNKVKYDNRIYVLCIGISDVNDEKITSVNQLNSSTFREIFFLGDCSELGTFSPTCGTINKKFEYCRYTEDQNIENLEHLFAEFIRYIESDHPMYTRDEVMYDYMHMTKQYMVEKSGFHSLEKAGLSITAPWRQNETVDIVINGRLNISMKTAYKSSKYSFSFTIKGCINVHLCDYVFAVTPLGIVILTPEEVYKDNKRTSFCWKIDSKPIISLACVRDVSSRLPIHRIEHPCIE